jgi:hypothetical protein
LEKILERSLHALSGQEAKKMVPPENNLDKELVEQELNTLSTFIEKHLDWARTHHDDHLARLNIVVAESLIESARLVEALRESLSEK